MKPRTLLMAGSIALLTTVLAACGAGGGGGGGGGGDGSAAISGTIYLPGSFSTIDSAEPIELEIQRLEGAESIPTDFSTESASALQTLDAVSTPQINNASSEAVRAGEIIIEFDSGTLFSQAELGTLSVDGVMLQHAAASGSGRHLYRSEDLTEAETLALAEELRAQPNVENAIPNYILHSFASPNDPLYRAQWHYDVINMEAAWDVTTGSSAVTVAVVDTGSINHSDLNFVGGYDFISSSVSAGDGDGRDPDPTDEGDNTNYHGAHVAGTIGANTNNNRGVAGVNWNVDLVAVRALGRNGDGTMFDILDGVEWAAGQLPGLPNPNPARIINLSLGASVGESCSAVLGGNTSFFTNLANAGIVVVAAAGNEGQDTSGVFPANCPGVITVGATGQNNQRPAYSNFGAEVDVMAPGGDPNATFMLDGTPRPLAVLSTVLDSNGAEGYGWQIGTSMAAPHVTGVIALMRAQNPGITFNQILSDLRSTTSEPVCSFGCGAGLIDAAAALGSGAGNPEPPPPTGDAAVYLLLSKCDSEGCGSATPWYYATFDSVTDTSLPYFLSGLDPDDYVVQAWQDLDGGTDLTANPIRLDIDDFEPWGRYPGRVSLLADQERTDIDVFLEPATD